MNTTETNYAFIDGQNLYMATTQSVDPWKIDLERFRLYLLKKYSVSRAYYYLGYVNEEYQDLYEEIQKSGFILVFKEHSSVMMGKKKGNVDSDIIFSIMKRLYTKEEFGKIVLVSGDGDYKQMVEFLIQENRFEKILFPDRLKRSSLYKSLTNNFFAYLDDKDMKNKIGKHKKKGALGS